MLCDLNFILSAMETATLLWGFNLHLIFLSILLFLTSGPLVLGVSLAYSRMLDFALLAKLKVFLLYKLSHLHWLIGLIYLTSILSPYFILWLTFNTIFYPWNFPSKFVIPFLGEVPHDSLLFPPSFMLFLMLFCSSHWSYIHLVILKLGNLLSLLKHLESKH